LIVVKIRTWRGNTIFQGGVIGAFLLRESPSTSSWRMEMDTDFNRVESGPMVRPPASLRPA
jgi:hypothetical protein